MAAVKFAVFEESEAQAPDPKQMARQLSELRKQAYEEGFRAGAEASAAEHAERQDQLRAGLVEAMLDCRQGHVEARAAVLGSLAPVLVNMVAALVPQMAPLGLSSEVVAAVGRALSHCPDTTVTVRCAAETEAALAKALSTTEGNVVIRPDPRLTPLEVRLDWDDGFDRIDTGRVVGEIHDLIEATLSGIAEPALEKKHAC